MSGQKSFFLGEQEYYVDANDKKEDDWCFIRRKVKSQSVGPIVGRKIYGSDETEYDIDEQGWGGEWVSELIESRKPRESLKSQLKLPSQVIKDFRENGLGIWENALNESFIDSIRAEVIDMCKKREICRSQHGQPESVRTDEVAFIDLTNEEEGEEEEEGPPHHDPKSKSELFAAAGDTDKILNGFQYLEGFGAQLQPFVNYPLLLPPLGMVSRYHKGSYYTSHRDNDRDSNGHWRNHRVITMILYLNEKDFVEKDGGQLLCHMENPVEVIPTGGKLVIFDTRRIKHEVLPSHRARFAMTLWFVSTDLLSEARPPCGLRYLQYCSPKEKIADNGEHMTRVKRDHEKADKEITVKKKSKINVDWAKLEPTDKAVDDHSGSVGFTFNFC